MNINRRIFVLSFLILYSLITTAQQKTTILGYVKDADNGEPLVFANVLIQGASIGTTTDENGFYELKNIAPGEYKVEVRMIGYKKQIRGVTIKDEKFVQLNFGLVTKIIELEEVTIEAGKTIDELKSVKINSKDIEKLAPTTTADILKEIPGISTSRSGSWGTKPYIEGMTDSRVLVFIDGVKTNQACPMGMDACTATIEPDMIESIEVQKGPGSALYGSGNMGGVINISSLSSEYSTSRVFKTKVNFAGKYESVSNSRTGTLSFSGGNKKFDFLGGFSGGLHDDYNTSRGVIENSGFKSGTVQLKTRYRPTSEQELLLTTQIYRAKDIGWPAANTIIPTEKRNTYALNYSVYNITDALQTIKAHISYSPMFHNMINYLPENRQYMGDSRTNSINANVDSYWSLGSRNNLTSGLFFSYWQMNATSRIIEAGKEVTSLDIVPNSSISEADVFVQDEFKFFRQFKITGGLRANYIYSNAENSTLLNLSQFELQSDEFVFTGSAGLQYNLSSSIFLFASVSKGFKAPTPVERYISAPMVDGFYRFGNPGLVSETNISKRVGLKGMQNRFNWSFELYHNSLSNLVSAEVDPDLESPIPGLRGVKQFVNITNGVIAGGSLFVGYYIIQALSLNASISYDWGENTELNEPLPGIAPFQSNIKLAYNNINDGYWMEFTARMAADQNRYAERYGEIYTPGYAVFDIRGGLKLTKEIELSAGIKNLFDRYYRDHLNKALIPEPGRNLYVRVSLGIPVSGFRSNEIDLKNTKQVELSIEGMACQFCVQTITERLNNLLGVVSVNVSLEDKAAWVIIREGEVSLDDLLRTVDRAGFKASFVSIEPVKEK